MGFSRMYVYWEKNLPVPVAATDLFPLANQCPRQEIRSLTDQSPGRAL